MRIIMLMAVLVLGWSALAQVGPTNAVPGSPPTGMTRVEAIERYWNAHKTNNATVRLYQKQMDAVQEQVARKQQQLQAATEKHQAATAAGKTTVPENRNPEIIRLNQEIAQLQKQYGGLKSQMDILKTSYVQSINRYLPPR